jgi:putative endonuclease
MFYYTYVLLSLKDNQLYIGWTDDLINRVEKHNKAMVEATKNRQPLRLIYYEACLNKDDAIKREKVLKTGFGREYIKRRLTI